VLSKYREEAHYKGISVGHSAVHEVDTGITQGKGEARIAREPVKVSDKQGAIHSPGLGGGREQLGPVILLATLDFDEFSDQLGWVRDERTHGSLLRFEAQTGGALLLEALIGLIRFMNQLIISLNLQYCTVDGRVTQPNSSSCACLLDPTCHLS